MEGVYPDYYVVLNCHSKMWVQSVKKNIPVMAKLKFQHHYSSLQCHMILQKSFEYADLMRRKHFLL